MWMHISVLYLDARYSDPAYSRLLVKEGFTIGCLRFDNKILWSRGLVYPEVRAVFPVPLVEYWAMVA